MAPKPSSSLSPLEASSYHHPNGGKLYSPLRAIVVRNAIEMGYDEATMVEHGISWADDQDPFGHVLSAAYPHWAVLSGFRMFESFAEQLQDKVEDLLNGRGIGVMTKSYETELKRPVTYPDSVIIAVRLAEVLPDRYFFITSMWSLRQQSMVAQTRGYVVFYDFDKKTSANLLEVGGVYADLHVALTERAKKSNELAARWEKRYPPRKTKQKIKPKL
ncbi:hypothetical protein GQ53DRAFT_358313 [Thozetella sp. PMI_491]|nr:hypothetical protein GQ53DRAFT_358313 [Thozetella sp. PMI_491]